MKRSILFLVVLLVGTGLKAQDISCTVAIDAQQTGKMQLSIFQTLQQSVEEFLNTTQWTNRDLPEAHRVQCSFFITIHSYSNNNFKASLQVRSSRPVFGASMTTPVFNFKDEQFDFSYIEHEPLQYLPNRFASNLVSTLSFYVYVILGLDADTFSPHGGADYFTKADQIARLAQQSGYSGWQASSGNNSRYELNSALNASSFQDYHQALYVYHRQGLDLMHKDLKKGKQNIVKAIDLLENVNITRPNTLIIRSFFDAKAKEVASIFTGGPSLNQTRQVVSNLYDMAPTYSRLWRQID